MISRWARIARPNPIICRPTTSASMTTKSKNVFGMGQEFLSRFNRSKKVKTEINWCSQREALICLNRSTKPSLKGSQRTRLISLRTLTRLTEIMQFLTISAESCLSTNNTISMTPESSVLEMSDT